MKRLSQFIMSVAWWVALLVVLAAAACDDSQSDQRPPTRTPKPTATARPTIEVSAATRVMTATPTPRPAATLTPAPTASPTPFYAGPLSDPCGVLLPSVPEDVYRAVTVLPGDAAAARDLVPAAARAAYDRLLDDPTSVGLVAYQVGREAEGIYWNADKPFPVASVAKLIILTAYAEAVTAGELDPDERVPLAELERYYLPNFDLGAHNRAIRNLREEGRVITDGDEAILLDDVAWIMIRFSSNAASDYLHSRLSQQRIEQATVDLGLADHSAPCTFLGQFLAMGNHVRAGGDAAAFQAYSADPALYGAEVGLLADAFSSDRAFRLAEAAWRQSTRLPSIATQRRFSAELATRGTAAGYAALMARLAQNGLSSPEASFIARRIVEWPTGFQANQALFSNVGYKNGSLPGVLATAYYAYRWNDPAPVVVVLFYRDVPQQTYRDWRRTLPHDELARWLLSDPAAIPALAAALSS